MTFKLLMLALLALILTPYSAHSEGEAYDDKGQMVIVEPASYREVWVYGKAGKDIHIIEPTRTTEYPDRTEMEYIDKDSGEVRVLEVPKYGTGIGY